VERGHRNNQASPRRKEKKRKPTRPSRAANESKRLAEEKKKAPSNVPEKTVLAKMGKVPSKDGEEDENYLGMCMKKRGRRKREKKRI